MRKFYVFYRIHAIYGEYDYYSVIVTLDKNEKANIDTFRMKLEEIGGCHKEVLSWSLIEE